MKIKMLFAGLAIMVLSMFSFASPASVSEVIGFTAPPGQTVDIAPTPEMAPTAILAVETYGGSKSILSVFLLLGLVLAYEIIKPARRMVMARYLTKLIESIKTAFVEQTEFG